MLVDIVIAHVSQRVDVCRRRDGSRYTRVTREITHVMFLDSTQHYRISNKNLTQNIAILGDWILKVHMRALAGKGPIICTIFLYHHFHSNPLRHSSTVGWDQVTWWHGPELSCKGVHETLWTIFKRSISTSRPKNILVDWIGFVPVRIACTIQPEGCKRMSPHAVT